MGDPKVMTDLTIGGIIDHWEPETVAASAPARSEATLEAQRDKAA
jgi:hypothetical protein